MSAVIHLAVDGMGGDFGPRLALSACRIFIERHPQVRISLFGDLAFFAKLLPQPLPGLIYVATEQVVAMDEKPAAVLRHKQDSSMGRAISAVASGQAHACVSAGNTGALMALSRHLLGTLPGVERPAICKPIPTAQGRCWMLDLGANLAASPAMLLEFAKLGAEQARQELQRRPSVALLNVGTEADKGPQVVRHAALLLAAQESFSYVGFIEASEIFAGGVDVVVCDGFAGNITLKASEGAARFVFGQLRQLLQKNLWSRLQAVFLKPILRRLYQQLNPASLNGALLLGLQGIVVKSHGGADVDGYIAALEVALGQIKRRTAVA